MVASSKSRRRTRGRSRGRSGGRPGGWGRGTVAIAALVLLAVGVGISQIDFGDTFKELTLPLRHDDLIREHARDADVARTLTEGEVELPKTDPALLAAVIYAESKFRDQTSSAGARGLMQITPETADTIESLSGGRTFEYEDLADPELNIRYGSFFLRYLLERYERNEAAALAAYNAGIVNADSWGGAEMTIDDIEFAETRAYVEEVLEKRGEYRKNYRRELDL
jgi:soluble lytic murein transglycosylase